MHEKTSPNIRGVLFCFVFFYNNNERRFDPGEGDKGMEF